MELVKDTVATGVMVIAMTLRKTTPEKSAKRGEILAVLR
jgi:hypothetical protein